MIAPGTLWKRRCQVAGRADDAAFNFVEVVGDFEGELRVRPARVFGPVISCTEESLRGAFDEDGKVEVAPAPDLFSAAHEWVGQ
jgi:hypothetical protein